MEPSPREIYVKAGYVASIWLAFAFFATVCLAVSAIQWPLFQSSEAYDRLVVFVGLTFLVAWFSTLGCYAIIFEKKRIHAYLLFGLFPPFALYTMFILFVKGRAANANAISLARMHTYALRAAIGWD